MLLVRVQFYQRLINSTTGSAIKKGRRLGKERLMKTVYISVTILDEVEIDDFASDWEITDKVHERLAELGINKEIVNDLEWEVQD